MPEYSVARASQADISTVHALLAAAGDALAARGGTNWVPAYPLERLTADVAQEVVWLVRDPAHAMVATYMLRLAPVHPYKGIAWSTPDHSARYMNRLAVHPLRQGEGIGSWCLAHIAESCAHEGVTAIRCDVITANVPLCRFYEQAGYVARGTREHSGWAFTCYERVLAT